MPAGDEDVAREAGHSVEMYVWRSSMSSAHADDAGFVMRGRTGSRRLDIEAARVIALSRRASILVRSAGATPSFFGELGVRELASERVGERLAAVRRRGGDGGQFALMVNDHDVTAPLLLGNAGRRSRAESRR